MASVPGLALMAAVFAVMIVLLRAVDRVFGPPSELQAERPRLDPTQRMLILVVVLLAAILLAITNPSHGDFVMRTGEFFYARKDYALFSVYVPMSHSQSLVAPRYWLGLLKFFIPFPP